jgi:hypothetical protein
VTRGVRACACACASFIVCVHTRTHSCMHTHADTDNPHTDTPTPPPSPLPPYPPLLLILLLLLLPSPSFLSLIHSRALCLPTFSHFLIVNKTSLSFSLSLSLFLSLSLSLSLSSVWDLVATMARECGVEFEERRPRWERTVLKHQRLANLCNNVLVLIKK